jgi:2-dehydro-3-deoxyphosphooctonate aldolase (KDO 8-P synthase)
LGNASGGQPEFIEPLARAAVAVGVDGLFVEVHDAPERALSDGPNALHLNLLDGFWRKMSALARFAESLNESVPSHVTSL